MNLNAVNGIEFKPISLSEKRELETLLAQRKHSGCESNFATLFLWEAAYQTKIAEGFGCKAAYNPLLGVLHFPYGKFPSPDNLKKFYDAFESSGALKFHFFYDVPAEYFETYPELSITFSRSDEPAEFDYLYSVDKLIEMRGAKLRKKRNLIKQFELEHPEFRVEIATTDKLPIISEFMLQSPKVRHFEHENAALSRAFDNFDSLGLKAISIFDTKEAISPIACAVLNKLSDEEWAVAFEKSLHEEHGAAQLIVLEEAKAIHEFGGKLMNREQDLGEENLRHAKESLDPIFKYSRARIAPISLNAHLKIALPQEIPYAM